MLETVLKIIVFLPFLGAFFVMTAHDEAGKFGTNPVNVAILTVISNIILILWLFTGMDTAKEGVQIISSFDLKTLALYHGAFGVDIMALMLILAAHIVTLTALWGLKNEQQSNKSTLFFAMLFLCALNGYFAALDLLTFYICFSFTAAAMFMQIGVSAGDKKSRIVERFFLYNFFGAFLLLGATVAIYAFHPGDVLIGHLSEISLPPEAGIWVWSSIFLAFVSRIPVWPFHYWIVSVNAVIKNPLVFCTVNLMPVVGLYGFLRFWPENVPTEIAAWGPLFEGLCVLTMIFIALRGYRSFSLRDKLFSYIVIYDLLYLLGVFLPTDILQMNIVNSLFAFLLAVSMQIVLVMHIERESAKSGNTAGGVLCLQPRTTFMYVVFVLAGIGLPVSALFWNNFIIISEIFNVSLYLGTGSILALILIAVVLLQNLYTMRDKTCLRFSLEGEKIEDIGKGIFIAGLLIMAALFLSFLKPLWFVF